MRPRQHKPDCFDYFCRFLNVATGLCAILCAVSYGMALAVYQPITNAEGLLDQALRVFGLLGAVLVAVIEIEWERLLLLVRFTEYWVGRAVVQVFIALLTFKMASPAGKDCKDPSGKDCDFHQSLELYRFVSAMALLGCGSIYFLGGILCFGLIKRSRSNRERKRQQAQKDLEELETKREALRGLLGRSD
jgi:amino acid transporter